MRLIQGVRERGRLRRGELKDICPEYRIWNLESRPEFQNDKDSCAPAPGVTFEMHLCACVCVTRKGTATDRQTWKRHETVGRYAKVD